MGKGSGSRSNTDYYVRGGHALPDVNSRQLSTSQEDPDQSTFVRNSTIDQSIPYERHVGPKGLLNVGNTCYANAALQCLLSTALTHALVDPTASAIFRRYSSNPAILEQGSGSVDSDEEFQESYSTCSPRRKNDETRKKYDDRMVQLNCEWLTRELNRITRDYHAPEPYTHSPTSWLGVSNHRAPVVDPGSITRHPNRLSPCLKPYTQEDAHEFLRALLGTLVKHGHNKELSSMFDGLLESSVVCQTCRRPSLTRDRYMDLSLDIASSQIGTLDEALKDFTKTEQLSGDNKVYCSRCDCKRTSTKGLRLATAPTILVTHLKRFAIDQYGRLVRLGKKVKFPLKLEIGDYMSRFNKARPPPYELVAVLVHQGVSCEYGHYIAYVKQCGDWYRCNDSVVEVVDTETVLNQQAYILMYEVADMRERHGFPSPNKSYNWKSGNPIGKKPDNTGFAFTKMLCGMEYDSTMFANMCYYASSLGKSSKPRNSHRGRATSEESFDDGIIVREKTADAGRTKATQTSNRRKFRRSSSSGNLSRLSTSATEEGHHHQSISLSHHRRHQRLNSFAERPRIKHSLSPVDNKRRSLVRVPLKGDLPPRPNSNTPMNRRSDGETR